MGEARVSCPFCGRKPGERHKDIPVEDGKPRPCPRGGWWKALQNAARLHAKLARDQYIWRSARVLTLKELKRLDEKQQRALTVRRVSSSRKRRSRHWPAQPLRAYDTTTGEEVQLYLVLQQGSYSADGVETLYRGRS